jgi:hypothetical protein
MWRRFLSAIFGRVRNTRRHWYAIKLARPSDALDHGWLVDFGPHGPEYSSEFGASIWYDTAIEARHALERAGESIDEHKLVRLTIRLDSNHYRMDDECWP